MELIDNNEEIFYKLKRLVRLTKNHCLIKGSVNRLYVP
ncbi:hypothetical protein TSAR_015639 [Trichomalopsis sarcophagae]|uniref:Uncharacterized protein n=1 Tax=Trichomalopsis sarcophagae TaxID=543379 RepID=A0A232EHK0_9HYME|nr:hypothetical protein TSAR_015639 [Trichomalopsis sarcophagae]